MCDWGPVTERNPVWYLSEGTAMAKKPRLGSGKRFAAVARSAGGGEKGRRIAAAVGRKKYGAKKMGQLSAAGRRRKKK